MTLTSKFNKYNYVVIDDFLDEEKFKEIQEVEYNTDYIIQKDSWPEKLFKSGGVETKNMLIQHNACFYGLHNDKSILYLQKQILSFLEMEKEKNIFAQSLFFDHKKSNIFWHNDEGYDYGVTYYISEHYDDNWGGELLLENGKWISPEPNRIIFIKSPFWHKTNPMLEDCPGDRVTLQTFIQKEYEPSRFLYDDNLEFFKKYYEELRENRK